MRFSKKFLALIHEDEIIAMADGGVILTSLSLTMVIWFADIVDKIEAKHGVTISEVESVFTRRV